MKKAITVIFVSFFAATAIAVTDTNDQSDLALTIYTDNFAVVKQIDQLDFKIGRITRQFTGVAEKIDPTSVSFKCLSSPGAVTILEQVFKYDLVNSEALLNRYIDDKITVFLKDPSNQLRQTNGILLASNGNDLITKPTLIWLIDSQITGSQKYQLTYTTADISWKADYTAILNQAENALSFSGQVTIDNQSGTDYPDAAINLIAGDVRRITEPKPPQIMMARGMQAEAADTGFAQQSFMDYHLYTLDRTATIENNQVKQIKFIPLITEIPAEKIYVYNRNKNQENVQVNIEFKNTEENNLGLPLPQGNIRVFKTNPDDSALEFVGEDRIDHTAKKEKLSLYIGNAFDITPEYTLVDSFRSDRTRRFTHKIELTNAKDQPVTVFAEENFPQHVNWNIEQATHPYKKIDADTIRFEVKINPDSTQTLKYTITQNW